MIASLLWGYMIESLLFFSTLERKSGMQNDYNQFEQRKCDHIELALMPANQSIELNFFDTFYLSHEALPDLDFNELNIQTNAL